jgi:serine/threonine protein phosphatase 1
MIYVTSDLHGYPLEKFKALLEKAEFGSDDFCYVLGDVIDRGTEGIKTLRWIMRQPNFELILGNHEDMMLGCDFILDEITEESIAKLTGLKFDYYLNWISNGGQQTLNELYALRREEIKYIFEFLEDAPLYAAVTAGDRDFILTHSGLGSFDKNRRLSEYSPHDLLWTRPSLETEYFKDITTVFGHTPALFYGDEYTGRAVFTDTWIDIDTGAAGGRSPMLLRLDDLKEFYAD